MLKRNTDALKLYSWSIYDFANTIFSAVVLTLYFPLLLTSLTKDKWLLGAATTGSMLLAGAITPFLGALTDATGKNKNYLVKVTLICIFFNALLGTTRNIPLLFTCFAAACFFYHLCLVLYNSLLPVAAPKARQGFASGLGVGLGYLGVVCVLPLMHMIEARFGLKAVFPAGALLFLLFSLPLFIFLPERKVENTQSFSRSIFFDQWKRLGELLLLLPKNPALLLFFAGNFFLVDAVNSTILWFSVFTKELYDPGQKALIGVMMGLNAAAFIAGILAGVLTDRMGSMRTLLFSSACLCAVLITLTQNITFEVYAAVTILGGALSIAGIWTAGRKRVLELAPADSVGEYFGIYGLTTKVSVLASLFYGIAADAVGMRQGLWVLVIPALIGFLLLLASSALAGKRKAI